MARQASQVQTSFHPDEFIVDQPHRVLVCPALSEKDPAGDFQQRRRAHRRDQTHRAQQCPTETIEWHASAEEILGKVKRCKER